MSDVFLDLETDGFDGAITVVGLYAEPGPELVQAVGSAITRELLERRCPAGARLYTFNGESFDLPRIAKRFGLHLRERCESVDLFRIARRCGMEGGQRRLEVATGFRAVEREHLDCCAAWTRWRDERDRGALAGLLRHNADDLFGLVALRDHFVLRGAVAARFG